jgi:recombination protein RecA
MYAEGISKEGGLLDVGLQMGLVKKSGAFFAYGETRLGQGRENAKEFLRQHPAVSAQLEHAIRREGGTVQGAADTGDDSVVQLALEA